MKKTIISILFLVAAAVAVLKYVGVELPWTKPKPASEQSASMEGASSSQTYQAGRDMIVYTLPNSSQEKDMVSERESLDVSNRYVRATKLLPDSDRRYGLLVEFGVRYTATEGAKVAVDVGGQYDKVHTYFDQPGLEQRPAGRPVTVFNSSKVRNPPRYFRKFSSPSLSPKKSYYLYFEGLEPLELVVGDFQEFVQ